MPFSVVIIVIVRSAFLSSRISLRFWLPRSRTVHSLGLHRDKGLETVAAMDVHHLADRTEAVGRRDIPLDLLVEISLQLFK